MIISGLQAKAKDRQWLKNQTSGELDDTKLIEGKSKSKFIMFISYFHHLRFLYQLILNKFYVCRYHRREINL